MIIAIDFDGTCVTHEYPLIGSDIGAISVLLELMENGHKLVLFTMRSGKELEAAVNFLESKGVRLYGVNRNPTQLRWTTSPKAYAELYIDDAALGCPLVGTLKARPYVDWVIVRRMLQDKGIIKESLFVD